MFCVSMCACSLTFCLVFLSLYILCMCVCCVVCLCVCASVCVYVSLFMSVSVCTGVATQSCQLQILPFPTARCAINTQFIDDYNTLLNDNGFSDDAAGGEQTISH